MKNWRTTLIGALGAALTVVLPLVQSGTVGVNDIVIAGILAALGYHSADKK